MAILFAVCSLKTNLSFSSRLIQYGLVTGFLISPEALPYVEMVGSDVTYFVKDSVSGSNLKK